MGQQREGALHTATVMSVAAVGPESPLRRRDRTTGRVRLGLQLFAIRSVRLTNPASSVGSIRSAAPSLGSSPWWWSRLYSFISFNSSRSAQAGCVSPAETEHATQKPVECMRRPMLNNSGPGQAVYEPFLGSGTTLIAAETTGRVCLAIELEPRYADISVRRWQAFTGKPAVLESTGRRFDEVAAERGASADGCHAKAPSPRPPAGTGQTDVGG
jgi:hypothetical protein